MKVLDCSGYCKLEKVMCRGEMLNSCHSKSIVCPEYGGEKYSRKLLALEHFYRNIGVVDGLHCTVVIIADTQNVFDTLYDTMSGIVNCLTLNDYVEETLCLYSPENKEELIKCCVETDVLTFLVYSPQRARYYEKDYPTEYRERVICTKLNSLTPYAILNGVMIK